MIYAYSLSLFVLGSVFGAAAAVWIVLRWWPRVNVHQVTVSPESIARGIAAGGGIHMSAPPVMVDWTLLHRVVEAEGYMLIAKNEPGAPKQH